MSAMQEEDNPMRDMVSEIATIRHPPSQPPPSHPPPILSPRHASSPPSGQRRLRDQASGRCAVAGPVVAGPAGPEQQGIVDLAHHQPLGNEGEVLLEPTKCAAATGRLRGAKTRGQAAVSRTLNPTHSRACVDQFVGGFQPGEEAQVRSRAADPPDVRGSCLARPLRIPNAGAALRGGYVRDSCTDQLR